MAKLEAYRAKRDFKATPEPDGGGEAGTAAGASYVIQKHDASRLHYDLRLELDGVMKSWAVAKGPSLVPGDKRLAVHTEDHPIAYNSFEGTIPKGQYGGGTVLLWDRGTWAAEGDPHFGYAKGHLQFRLSGEKLAGAWHLVRMRQKPREKQEAWLLIKSEDEAAREAGDPDILEEQPLSVATGRDLEAIASARDGAVWQSDREGGGKARGADPSPAGEGGLALQREPGGVATPDVEAPPHPGRRRRLGRPLQGKDQPASEPSRPSPGKRNIRRPRTTDLTSGGVESALPRSIEPCLATLVDGVPRGERWIHEIKWDGYRLLAFRSPRTARLATRRGLDWTHRFPAIAEGLRDLAVESVVLDGEAVVEGPNGVASFSALQNALSDEHGGIARTAILYAFDLLYLNGFDLRGLALEERKARLAALIPAGGTGAIRLGEHLAADGEAMARSAASLGLEGIVSKRRDRPYRSGRGDDWVKVKFTERQEFVVVGYVPSTASRRAIGSLVLGYHEDGRLRLAGRSGTGYSGEVARALWNRLDAIRRPRTATDDKPTTEERRGVVWVEPQVVAEIEFRGWTGEDRLRHAAFKGLREDKAAAEVVRERPAGIAASGGTSSPKPRAAPRPAAAARRSRNGEAEVAGVPLTHPDRVLWSDSGTTKQGLAEYYEEVAGWLLPHLVDRPLSLVRCPGGSEDGCFFQKHAWAGLRDDVLRRSVREESGEEEEILYVRTIAGVITLVQASVLEIHPWGSTMADVERPDRIVMDLDPGEGVDFAETIAAAREVRERLRAAKLESFVKTTGGKGLHVVVPLTGPEGWAEVKGFAKDLADQMAADSPRRFIAKATKRERGGLIYVDYLRNGRGATAIAAYSTRARPGAPVSVPLRWEELEDFRPGLYTLGNVPARLGRLRADPWADLAGVKQRLPGGTRRPAAKRPR